MSMCYQKLSRIKSLEPLSRTTKQRGSSIVLALFVIIILTLLGSVLMRMISTSSETVSQEVLGTRAYMAANSAMQAELQLLFPLNTATLTYCNSPIIDKPYDLGDVIPGLYDCEAETSCTKYHTDATTNIGYYRLTSTGMCGSGVMASDSKVIVKSSRTIQVEARSL